MELLNGKNEICLFLKNQDGISSTPSYLFEKRGEDLTTHRNMYLLAVGFNDYEKDQKLKYCVKDARETINAFATKRQGIERAFHQTLLTDASFEEDILLSQIETINARIKREDIFVFYYSGHGIATQTEEVYDFSMIQTNGKFVSFNRICDMLAEIKAQHVVIMIDACQSGVLTDMITAGILEDKLFQLNRNQGINVLSSSQSREYSAEIDQLQHGLFTLSLLNSFYSDDDDLISIWEITENIRHEIELLCNDLSLTADYPKVLTTGYDFVIASEQGGGK